MSVKKNDLIQYIGGLQALTDEVPEIMSKIVLLAEDRKIKDPSILEQIV